MDPDGALGSGNPLNEDKPMFSAVLFTILFDLMAMGTLAAALFTDYWFTTNTGARYGLRTMVIHDWICGQQCYSEIECEGDWKASGEMMFGVGCLCLIMIFVSIIFQCCNLTPDASRKKALAGCCMLDMSAMICFIGLGMYYIGTNDTRSNTAPDSNGIVTTYAPGSSYICAMCAALLMVVAVISGVVAKPPPLDEGMQSTVELEEQNHTAQMAHATKAFAKSY